MNTMTDAKRFRQEAAPFMERWTERSPYISDPDASAAPRHP